MQRWLAGKVVRRPGPVCFAADKDFAGLVDAMRRQGFGMSLRYNRPGSPAGANVA